MTSPQDSFRADELNATQNVFKASVDGQLYDPRAFCRLLPSSWFGCLSKGSAPTHLFSFPPHPRTASPCPEAHPPPPPPQQRRHHPETLSNGAPGADEKPVSQDIPKDDSRAPKDD